MILSHKHKFIFIHIGKNAGTSIQAALCDSLDIPREETGFNREILDNLHKIKGEKPRWATNASYAGIPTCEHINAEHLMQIVGEKVWSEYFKFAFVRNPYSRLVSLFHWFRKQKKEKWLKYDDFRDFLGACKKGEHDRIRNGNSQLITDKKDNLLVDFVGKYENLNTDFKLVCDRIGLTPLSLPHINKTNHKHYSSYYERDDKRAIYRYNKKDFHMFEYSPEL